MQKISIEKTLVDDPERFSRIEQLYESAIGLEERNNLEKRAMLGYVTYLGDQHKYEPAIHWAKRYKHYAELSGNERDIASSCHNLGIIYSDTHRYQESETEHLRAKEIQEKLVVENPDAYLPDLASSCNGLGNLYSDTSRYQEAEAEYLRAKEIREALAANNPATYLPDLASSCHNLGNLYSDTSRYKEAEAEYLRAKDIYESLMADNPSESRRQECQANDCWCDDGKDLSEYKTSVHCLIPGVSPNHPETHGCQITVNMV